MLSPRLTNCPECANIPSLLKKIDCKLAELGNSLYNNVSYMLNQAIPAGDILQLIAYRRILLHKYINPDYAYKYSVNMIASRVIRLTVGCVSKCNTPEPCLEVPCNITIVENPTTTTTSSSSTSTTTSSSSTTTTTTTIACKIYTLKRNVEQSVGWQAEKCTDGSNLSGISPITGSSNTPCIRQGSLILDAGVNIMDTNNCDACISYTIKCFYLLGGTWSATSCKEEEVGGSLIQGESVATGCIHIETLVLNNVVITVIDEPC